MKRFVVFFAFIIFCSCDSQRNYGESDCVTIYDKKDYDIYTMFYCTKLNDTLLLIGKKSKLENCVNSKYVDKRKLKILYNLELSTGDSVIFHYKVRDTNKKFMYTAGGGAPGQPDKVYFDTYSQFPLYLDDCSNFKGACGNTD